MKYGELNLGQIEAIVNKLGGMTGVSNLLSGKSFIRDVKDNLKVWKVIKLGTHKNIRLLYEKLVSDGVKITKEWMEYFLSRPEFIVSEEEKKVNLVKISITDLGFKGHAHYGEICIRAREFGLELCSCETIFQLRLQYKNQPENECLTIMTELINDSRHDIDTRFRVERHEMPEERLRGKCFLGAGELMDDALRIGGGGNSPSKEGPIYADYDQLIFTSKLREF